MALPTASDNPYPSLLVTEGSAPASPASGKQRLFIDSADHHLKRRSSGGAVTDIEAGGGGGGTDLVQTYAGSGSIYVPGLRGSPDAEPASPNAADDEFETLSGWTVLGSLGTSNVSDFPSHWHAVKASSGLSVHGIYKAAPAMPFTVTAKFADYVNNGNYVVYGLGLGDGTAAAWDTTALSVYPYAWTIQRDVWTNNTTRSASSSAADKNAGTGCLTACRYLRLVVASTSSVTAWISDNGMLWTPGGLGTYSPGFASKVGLVVSANGVQAECVVDWIRFT